MWSRSRRVMLLAFAAIKKGGRVVTWGFGDSGGNSDNVRQELSADVEEIAATYNNIAAIKKGGRVVTWGSDRIAMALK